MRCTGCRTELPDEARFCPACGTRVAEEDPARVAEYATALKALAGRTEAWAVAELARLREELGVRRATHDRLTASLLAPSLPLSAWVDALAITEFRAGELAMVRLRVVNEGERPLAALRLRATTTAHDGPLEAQGSRALGPGEDDVLAVRIRPTMAGHHGIAGTLAAEILRGPVLHFRLDEIAFLVGQGQALQQQIHIDARAQRVGIFENIGTAAKGGLVAKADWRRVGLTAIEAPPEVPAKAREALPTGHRGTGTVVPGDGLVIELDGAQGPLVELDDPALRAVLRPGDRLEVTVIGTDGGGRPLFSTRRGAAPAPVAPSTAVVGPGGDLHAALVAGGKITVSGTHRGPFVVERPVELDGDGVLEADRGPVLRIRADAVVKGLAVRGAAPAGAYAADAVEIAGGRVVLERCTVSSDAPGNLVPGRAVAVSGRADVELRACTLCDSGVAVAVDVSWSGFPTDGARGARVRLMGGTIARVGTGIAVAGEDREVHADGVAFDRIADRPLQLHPGGRATTRACTSSGAPFHGGSR